MKTIKYTLLLFALTFLAGCATEDRVNQLEYELLIVNQKFQELQAESSANQQRQADSNTQVNQLEGEISTLKGELEETQHLNRTLKEQNKELNNQFTQYSQDEKLKRQEEINQIRLEQQAKELALKKELNEKIRIQEENLKAIQKARAAEAQRKAEEKKKAAELARKKADAAAKAVSKQKSPLEIHAAKHKKIISAQPSAVSTNAPKKVPKPSSPKSSKTEANPGHKKITPAAVQQKKQLQSNSPSSADALYKQQKYDLAFKEYEKIADKAPESKKGVTATFMMGECLYQQGLFSEAMHQYQKAYTADDSHTKAPEALLKQGIIFEDKLEEIRFAKMVYKKLLNEHPSSKEAAIAKQRLENL